MNVEEPTKKLAPEKQSSTNKDSLKREVSGFSLSSIALKKAAKKINRPEDKKENLPHENFEVEKMLELWMEYAEKIKIEGKQNIASIMRLNQPHLKNQSIIGFSVANDMNKVEMIREQEYLLPFLREKLNHYGITIELEIKESLREDSIYSPQEKYQYLVKLNPTLEVLRKNFDLDF